ncbi:MAG: hypothetical protein QG608_937 [Actinomycetota bacterium]|nr:hypothetical protein [Actinomycetota bacterium]
MSRCPFLGITVEERSAIPLHEQIRSQIAGLIQVGVLSPGVRLPSIRSLARELDVAVNTVARAYRALEDAGLVRSRRRSGTVVLLPDRSAQDWARIRESVRRLTIEIAAVEMDEDTAIALLRDAMTTLKRPDCLKRPDDPPGNEEPAAGSSPGRAGEIVDLR